MMRSTATARGLASTGRLEMGPAALPSARLEVLVYACEVEERSVTLKRRIPWPRPD
jgi:hypothetical protein